MQKKENGPLSNWAVRGMFLELWNTTKSLSAIWQIFSCLLTCQGDCKNYRTKNMHENEIPLWLFEQEKAANPVNLAAIFCLGFGHGNQISCIFFWSLLVKYFYYNLRTHPIISTVWKISLIFQIYVLYDPKIPNLCRNTYKTDRYIRKLKYGFCKKSLDKNATLTSWTLFSSQKGTCIVLQEQVPFCEEKVFDLSESYKIHSLVLKKN